MRNSSTRNALYGAGAAISLLALAACGSGSSGGSTSTTAAASSAAPAASSVAASESASASASASGGAATPATLKGVCPDTIVVQTDWNPEVEHGATYQLLGPNPTIDAGKKKVSGPLYAGGKDMGVKLEIRAGGPAIGYQAVTAQMYTDKSITMGYVSTDNAIQDSGKLATLAVVSPQEISPLMLMWDPAKYPDVTGIADLGKKNVKVLYFNGNTYMEYLLGKGLLNKAQVDGSYDGTPANFVAARGANAQQGFATAEPYIYENEVAAWKKPVKIQLISDTGYAPYSSSLAIRSGEKETLAPCLKLLVPIMQQAQIDYAKTPATATALILELVKQYNTGWVYSQGVADYSIKKQVELGIISNGSDTTLGNFDAKRVQDLIGILEPIFAKQGKPIKAGLKPEEIFTNEFIDPSISWK